MRFLVGKVSVVLKKFKTKSFKKDVDDDRNFLHNLVSLLLTNKTIRSDANGASRSEADKVL